MDTLLLAKTVECVLLLALVVWAGACILGWRQAKRQARGGLAWWRAKSDALRMSMQDRGDSLGGALRTIAMQPGIYPAVATARDTARALGSAVVFPATNAASHADEWVGALWRWTHLLKNTATVGGVVASSLATALGISAMLRAGPMAMLPFVVSGAIGVAMGMGIAIVAGWIEVGVDRMRGDAEEAASDAALVVEAAIRAWRRAECRVQREGPATPNAKTVVRVEQRTESAKPDAAPDAAGA